MSAGKRELGQEPEYELQQDLPVISRTASRIGCQSVQLREEEEQEIPLSAVQPQGTQQDEAELQTASKDKSEEEGTSSTNDDSVDETKTVKDDEEVEPDIDPAAQQISKEFEVSRQGSVVQPIQPSPTFPNPKKVIQQLEEVAVEDWNPNKHYALQELEYRTKQHNINTWSIIYKPTEAFKKHL